MVELEDEATWLRHRIMRLRAAPRFSTVPDVETILREVIADSEDRLARLESRESGDAPR